MQIIGQIRKYSRTCRDINALVDKHLYNDIFLEKTESIYD